MEARSRLRQVVDDPEHAVLGRREPGRGGQPRDDGARRERARQHLDARLRPRAARRFVVDPVEREDDDRPRGGRPAGAGDDLGDEAQGLDVVRPQAAVGDRALRLELGLAEEGAEKRRHAAQGRAARVHRLDSRGPPAGGTEARGPRRRRR